MLSFGSGNEILIDFGDLYGDAIKAIRQTDSKFPRSMQMPVRWISSSN